MHQARGGSTGFVLMQWSLHGPSRRGSCLFVVQLSREHLTHQMIKCYLSAIRFFSITTGHGDTFIPGAMPVLQYVLRGVKWCPRPPSRTCLPLIPAILRAMKAQWIPHAQELDYITLWAACCVGSSGQGNSPSDHRRILTKQWLSRRRM